MNNTNLSIDPEQLWGDLMETAKIGATEKGGINRLTLTDLDRQVRDWFKARAMSLGATVTVDDMGAMFARRPGQRADVPPIALGSHLDTQPTGGKFDGCLGVHAALEVMRVLHASGYETFAPIEVINWTNEEGSRFTPAMVSSGVFAGAFAHDWASSRPDRSGMTFGQALEEIGYRGPARCGENHPLSAFFELHIEQGPKLEIEGKDIGIVVGVQGIRWFEVSVTGADRHAGTTPMPARRDALLAAARMIDKINGIALANAPLAVSTVGLIEAKPNSPNVVAGDVFFTVDLRHPESATLAAMEDALGKVLAEVAAQSRCEIDVKKILDQPPVKFNEGCIEAVRDAARDSGFSTREIVSGAGHDAGYVSRVAPASMIFVPCKDGISHNEAEFTSKEQCAAGAQVLLRAVLAYDRKLAETYGKK
jgi:N-carbamoyl-L-amino-acid hydrolase